MIKRQMMFIAYTYLALLAFLFVFQRKLQYIPMGKVGKVSQYSLADFSEKKLTTDDGVEILTWYKKPQKGQKIILYFHGNAGNIGDRSDKFRTFAVDGFGLLAVSYHGYAGSGGKPSEKNLMMDGNTALKFLLSEGFQEKDIIVFGESLGSGIATQLAAEHQFFALILESPFSSIVNVAQKQYWFVPVRLLLHDKFESIKFTPKITEPVLIFHGTSDGIVPYSEGKKLFDAITSEKKLVTVDGAGHLDFSPEFILQEMKNFLSSVKPD